MRTDDNGNFTRVNTRITKTAMLRLQQACEDREKREPGNVPHGRILVELIMEHLKPHPSENGTGAGIKRKQPRTEAIGKPRVRQAGAEG